jgi:predicted dehydrogenase
MTGGRSATTTERLKIGIVGGGAITQVAHLPVLKKMRGISSWHSLSDRMNRVNSVVG